MGQIYAARSSYQYIVYYVPPMVDFYKNLFGVISNSNSIINNSQLRFKKNALI